MFYISRFRTSSN